MSATLTPAAPRLGVRAAPATVVLLGPVALAFAKGGYYPEARWWAGLVAWALVALAAARAPVALPRGVAGRIAVAALAGLTVWTALGLAWAPLSIPAVAALQRDVVYLGAFLAAAAWLRGRAGDWVEPAVCAGALVVVGFALAERWLPGLVELARSKTAAGRLEQPYTYSNAMGALAALGWVLAVRLAADPRRAPGLQAAAAAAGVPLALGLWLSFSRGALAAALAGLAVLVLLTPVRRQVWAAVVAMLVAMPVIVAAVLLPGITELGRSLDVREAAGAGLLAVTGLSAAVAALAARRLGERGDADRRLGLAWRRALLGVAVLGVLGLGVAVVAAERRGGSTPRYGATVSRFGSADSLRYEYWRVAVDEWRAAPLRGGGPGSFQAAWLRERRVDDTVHQAHSLYLQTLAELGVVGLALLAAFLAALGAAGRRAWRSRPATAAGPVAALVVFFVHAGLDWDWEMPALTLVAMGLAGTLVALAEREDVSEPAG